MHHALDALCEPSVKVCICGISPPLFFVWQDKETFTATVLDVNQGGLICRCQSLQAFIPISQLNREKDTWLSPEVSCCAVLCCGSGCCLALPSLGPHLKQKNAVWPLVHLLSPILRAKSKETCCFSCISSTRLNRGSNTCPSLEIIYSACCACHAVHAS